jgi:hypothetical protein
MQKEQVYCKKCIYIQENDFGVDCTCPLNNFILTDSFFQAGKKISMQPEDLNRYNNCRWYIDRDDNNLINIYRKDGMNEKI